MNKEERDISVRLTILEALIDIKEELDRHEQTTHGTLGGGDILSVSRALCKVWENPDSYTISDLSQMIRKFIEAQKLSY